MDANDSRHPTVQALHAYALGKLYGTAVEAMERHLEKCIDCTVRVGRFATDRSPGKSHDARHPADEPGRTPRDAAPPTSTLPPGLANHPDYEVVRELGQGGMGVVYLASNRLMGRFEVLKVVGGQMIGRPGVRDRFLREIQSAAKLQHRNIVVAYSVMRLGNDVALAMEYVEGDDLAKLVKAAGPLPVANACYYIHQTALGLQHAHEKGMVHRDIKPANLILAREGKKAVVKILDFGLAKVTSEGRVDTGLTREGQMLGTPEYIAPEQIRDAQSADIRADIYSLGCTFYYLLTGSPPFRAAKLWDLYQAHFSMDADPLNLVRPEVPAELAALVATMLAKDPDLRFQTPGEVAQALLPFFKPAGPGRTAPGIGTPHVNQVVSTTDDQFPQVQSQPPGAASAISEQDSSGPKVEGVAWEGLIEFKEAGRPSGATPALAPRRPRPKAWPSLAAGVLLAGLLGAWMIGSFDDRSRDGVLVLANLPPDAEVYLDGEPVKVRWPDGDRPVEVAVEAGKRKVRVKKEGFRTFGEDVTIKPGGSSWIRVGLVPLPPSDREEEGAVEVGARPDVRQDGSEVIDWPGSLSFQGQVLPSPGPDRRVTFACMSPDSRRLSHGISEGKGLISLHFLDASDPRNDSTFPQNLNWIYKGCFSPDGKSLATTGQFQYVGVWDTATGKLTRLLHTRAGDAYSVAYSPDGRLVAAGLWDRPVKVWDVATGELRDTFIGHTDMVWCLAFSADGKRLASGSGPWGDDPRKQGEVRLWDRRTGGSASFDAHARRVHGLAFSPDGRYLATAGHDRTAKVWDSASLRCVATFDRHPDFVNDVRFSPDGRLAVSIARETLVRVWEPATGREIAALAGLPGHPDFVQFSPQGRWIYAASREVLKAWEVPANLRLQP